MSAPGSPTLEDILARADGFTVSTPNGPLTLRLFGGSQGIWFEGRNPWDSYGSASGQNFVKNPEGCPNTLTHRYLICLAAMARDQAEEIARLKSIIGAGRSPDAGAPDQAPFPSPGRRPFSRENEP